MRGMLGADQHGSALYSRIVMGSGQPQQGRGRSAMMHSSLLLQNNGSGTQSLQQPPSLSPGT